MIVPLGKRVVVRPDPPKTETDSGLALVPGEAGPADRGSVVSKARGLAGPHVPNLGARVIFAAYAGTKVTDTDGTELVVLPIDEIIAEIR